MGTINNDPEMVKNVKLGDRITIPEADISDWLYHACRWQDGGQPHDYGHSSNKMPAEEVDWLVEAMLADPVMATGRAEGIRELLSALWNFHSIGRHLW